MFSKKSSPDNKVLAWGILLILTLVWGTSFILIKKSLTVFSSAEVGALRIVISFFFLAPMAVSRFRKPSAREWKYLVLIGVIGCVAPAFLFAKAQTGIDSSLAGILNSLTPLFTMIIAVAFFHFRIKWFNVAGVFIALTAAIGLISISGDKSFSFNIQYAIFVIIATVCYAINVNLVKFHLKALDPLTITVFSFFTIGIPILIYLLFFTGFIPKFTHDPQVWKGLGYVSVLAIAGTALALMLFNKLIKIASPVFAASVTYMIPVVAVIWGIIDGEIFKLYFIFWIALILLGVFLINYEK